MLSKMLLASALLGAAMFGSVSASTPSVGTILNPSFEETFTHPNHGHLLPLDWDQWGLGSDANPTVVVSSDYAHTGTKSAQFLPKSVTGLGGTTTYISEMYQQVSLKERGQKLTLSYWVFYGGVPVGVNPSTSGRYNFSVSYDHDEHPSQLITPVWDSTTGTANDHFFYRYVAEWYAPEQHNDHDNVYITLRFLTTDTAIYIYLDDISLTSPFIIGDPQFVGLRGQTYQVHGIDGAIYNLVSSPTTQVNAQFSFLSEGECPVFDGIPDTNCWAHPGSYLGSIGIQEVVNGKVHQVAIVAGPAETGFVSVIVDGQLIGVGTAFEDTEAFSIDHESSHRVTVRTAQFDFTFDNSDMFVNQAISSRVPISSLKCHGLFGQTHQRKVYPTSVKYIAGDVDDYMIEENTLFGKDFVYNQFQS